MRAHQEKELNANKHEEAPDKWLYEYCIVRYLPRPERGEFVNIGLLMMCKRQKWLKGKILIDPDKLKALNPGLDLECLKTQTALFEKKDVPQRDIPVEEKYRWLAAEKSASIRVSPSHPGLILESQMDPELKEMPDLILESEFIRLFRLLVM